MKASVIMPVYNAEEHIAESIKSILGQSFEDFELIVVNDSSTDSSMEVVKSFNDPRIKIVNLKENIGDALAMNEGIAVAKGEYIFRMDSDDISAPDRLEKQVNYMDQNPNCVVCGSWAKSFGRSERLFDFDSDPEKIKSNLLFFNSVVHPSVAIRKKFLEESGLRYTKEFPHAEDFDLWTRISEIAEIHNIPEALLSYRVHESQIGSKFRSGQTESAYAITKRQVENFLGNLSELQDQACRIIVNVLICRKPTVEEKAIMERLFEDIVRVNDEKQIFNKKALGSTINNLRKREEKLVARE